MFFACDHSYTGPYLVDALAIRKERKAKEREGSISSQSSSERTSSSERGGLAIGGFFHRKSARKAAAAAAAAASEKLSFPPPPTLSRTPSIATDDGIGGRGGSWNSGRALPPAVTPPELVGAQALRDVVRPNGGAPTAAAIVTKNFERLSVRTTSCESLNG
jgi:hypothetical protein